MKKIFKNLKEKKKNNKRRNTDNFVYKSINNAKNISSKLKKETKKENNFLINNIKKFYSLRKSKNSSKKCNQSF